MKPHSPDTWSRLAAARAEVTRAHPRDTEAPFGFASRVVARWQDLSRSERFQFWRVWTLRASLAAMIVFALAATFQPAAQASSPVAAPAPLETPSLTIPLP